MDLGTRAPLSQTVCGDLVLEDMGIVVERVHDDPPTARADTIDVPGRDGTVLRGITYEPRTITLECRLFERTWEDFETLRDVLVTYLMTHGEMQLILRTHPDEYYMAHFNSMTEGDRVGGTGIGYLELEFTANSPWRYGDVRSVTIPSGGSATFLVNGNLPATASVTSAAAYRDNSSTVWGVRFDEGNVAHIATGSSSARAVVIDGMTRSATIEGAVAMITLDSNWPELLPGSHTVRMDEGTGQATLTWQERSL